MTLALLGWLRFDNVMYLRHVILFQRKRGFFPSILLHFFIAEVMHYLIFKCKISSPGICNVCLTMFA